MTWKVSKVDGSITATQDKIPKILKVRLNEEEKEMLIKAKEIMEQTKYSTLLKQLATIGAFVVFDKKQSYILKTIYANKRKNKRQNIVDFM